MLSQGDKAKGKVNESVHIKIYKNSYITTHNWRIMDIQQTIDTIR